jgi:putative AbiEi antitoxin of type IV toxin-antitoxin system
MKLGLISREEAPAKGISQFTIYRRVKRGDWQEVSPGIYLPSPLQPTYEQRVLAACR